jgi:hypothetical protein
MFALVLVTGGRWRCQRRAHLLALASAVPVQRQLQLRLPAELHLTSGIVAVLIGLMIVPNAVLGRACSGSRSRRASARQRDRDRRDRAAAGQRGARGAARRQRRLGHLAVARGDARCVDLQRDPGQARPGRQVPLFTPVAWSMLYAP